MSHISQLLITCPRCGEKSIIDETYHFKCTNRNCNYIIRIGDPDYLKLFKTLQVQNALFHNKIVSLPEIKITNLEPKPQIPGLLYPQPQIPGLLYPQNLIPGFHHIYYAPDDEERKTLYWGSFITSSIIIIGFLIVLSFLNIPWQTLTFDFLLAAFLVSRGADILSTFFVLNLGGIETNPLSDPHDITKLLSNHGFQIILILIFGYILGLLNHWLGNGFLLLMTITGFRAALSNITQPLNAIFLPSSPSEAKALFYVNALICSIIVCVAVYFTSPYFIAKEARGRVEEPAKEQANLEKNNENEFPETEEIAEEERTEKEAVDWQKAEQVANGKVREAFKKQSLQGWDLTIGTEIVQKQTQEAIQNAILLWEKADKTKAAQDESEAMQAEKEAKAKVIRLEQLVAGVNTTVDALEQEVDKWLAVTDKLAKAKEKAQRLQTIAAQEELVQEFKDLENLYPKIIDRLDAIGIVLEKWLAEVEKAQKRSSEVLRKGGER